jgi:hypothetical protein
MAAPVAAVAGFLVLRKVIGWSSRSCWSLVVVAAVYFVVTGVQVWLTSRSEPQKSQAIVIMGSAQYNGVPSPDLLARLQDADALYREHLAPLVVATGAKEPGDNLHRGADRGRMARAQRSAGQRGHPGWRSHHLAEPVARISAPRAQRVSTRC